MPTRSALSFAFALPLLLSLAACGGSAKSPITETTAPFELPGSSPSSSPTQAPAPAPPQNPAAPPLATQIQNESGWRWCTAQMDGHECASGKGNATSAQVTNLADPSLSGASAKFSLGGHTPYSNALWWKSIGAHSGPTHFTYDLNFYIDNAAAPEALEFDVNQSFGGNRYVWGTQCSYKDSGKWDVWDGAAGRWESTSVPCPQVSSNQWHHLVWQFERKAGQVHYISVTLDGKTSKVDLYRPYQANFGGEDISVAFQMDGDVRQTPFNVWLDKVSLTAW